MKKKLTASEKLQIIRKQHYDSLSPSQKKEHDRIIREGIQKRTAEAQKTRGYKTKSEGYVAPNTKRKAVTLKKTAVKLKHKAKKK